MFVRQRYTALACILLLGAGGLCAQGTNASLFGTVTDSSGGAIAKAAVTATNTLTGVNSATVSNDAGVYIFASLQPGEYRITAEHTGFRRALTEHIRLEVSAKVTVNFTLQ